MAVGDKLKQYFWDDKQQKFYLLSSIVDPRFKALKFLPSGERSLAFEELACVAGEAFSQEEQEPDTVAPPVKRKKPSDFLS